MSEDLSQQPSTPPKRPAHFSWGPFILTLIADGMIAWTLYMVFFGTIPEANQRVADILVGNIVVAWIGARTYWYGTTYGSQAKDRTIAKSPPVQEHP